jgi:ABC-type taurine transport system substrate-binding protein
MITRSAPSLLERRSKGGSVIDSSSRSPSEKPPVRICASCRLSGSHNIGRRGSATITDITLAKQIEAAKSNDLNAMLNLAKSYKITGDYAKSFELFSDAAKAGSESAEVGKCYANGLGVKKSKSKAVHYFKLAAESGNSAALFYYGEALMKGKGVAKDKVLGGRKITCSAELNFPPAMFKFQCRVV